MLIGMGYAGANCYTVLGAGTTASRAARRLGWIFNYTIRALAVIWITQDMYKSFKEEEEEEEEEKMQ